MKNTTNKWCKYQNRSKFARRGFSTDVNTIIISTISMIQPVQVGPVRNPARRKPTKPWLFLAESWATLFKWAIVWTQEKKTIAHATTI